MCEGPCSLWMLLGRILPCFFPQLLVKASNPLHNGPCRSNTPVSASVFPCKHELTVTSYIYKDLFPTKITFWGYSWTWIMGRHCSTPFITPLTPQPHQLSSGHSPQFFGSLERFPAFVLLNFQVLALPECAPGYHVLALLAPSSTSCLGYNVTTSKRPPCPSYLSLSIALLLPSLHTYFFLVFNTMSMLFLFACGFS